ncbi:putative cubilin [Aphelenchoides fujianensis]|nr:putative cubilin [Aphelenchoides fujianensis]
MHGDFVRLFGSLVVWIAGLPPADGRENALNGMVVGSDSRIVMVNGNLFFTPGPNKTITFAGRREGQIFFGDLDIALFPTKTQMQTFTQQVAANAEGMRQIRRSNAAVERFFPSLRTDVARLKLRYAALLAQMKRLNDTRARQRTNRRLVQMITTLSGQVDRLLRLMKTDECAAAPCRNGATCIDLFGDFHCLCPPHFEGRTCGQRVDECRLFSGTHAGCQNGGTCSNNANGTAGFSCACPPAWHGPLCQFEHTDCSRSPEICGPHGRCLDRSNNGNTKVGTPLSSPHPSVQFASYDCICEWGFRQTNNPLNPTCVDIDECADAPCFPGSSCLNLPGSFQCGFCPSGYIGNGVQCTDIDECAHSSTNECSEDPLVECINTKGGYRCGQCPAGYTGDGRMCTKIPFCDPDPCVSNAKCLEHEKACVCPKYYRGDGLKEGNGCDHYSYYDTCTCSNGGSCGVVPTEDSATGWKYRCYCPLGFHGRTCQYVDRCVQSDYCNNRGNCTRNGDAATCDCRPGFLGDRCEEANEDSCLIKSHEPAGNIDFDADKPKCTAIVELPDTRKVVKYSFEWILPEGVNTSRSCQGRELLQLYAREPIDSNHTGFILYCFEDRQTSIFKPHYSESNKLGIKYQPGTPVNGTTLRFKWESADKLCGGRFHQPEGHFEYTSKRAEEDCLWYVSVQAGHFLELTVETTVMLSGELVFDDSFLSDGRSRLLRTCQTEAKPTVRRLSGRNAVVRLRLDSYAASAEQLAKCPLGTASTNNTAESPMCRVYFSVSYRSLKMPEGCGGELRLFDPQARGEVSGVLESPNFDHAYFPDLNCVWTLDATGAFNNSLLDEMESIELEFISLDIRGQSAANQTGCPGDRLVIASEDAATATGEEDVNLERGFRFVVCNEQPPPRMQLHLGARVQLQFLTDGRLAGRGFQLRYRPVCQQTVPLHALPPTVGFNGTLRSPNLRAPSAAAFRCAFRLLAAPHQHVRLRFEYIGLKRFSLPCLMPGRYNMTEDYVQLSGGHSTNAHFNRRYFCARFPFVAPHGEVVATGTSHYDVVYSTSGSADNLGFQVFYEVTPLGCGAVFTDRSGRFTSPGYPDRYPSQLYCVYDIVQPDDGQGVRLVFDAFDVENVASRADCGFDVVRVYEFYDNEREHGRLLGEFCGVRPPPPILVQSNRLSVVFLSDRSVAGTGFSAHWDAVDLKTDCDRTFTETSGVIAFNSTDFPRATSCTFRISLPVMNRVLLTVENLTMPCESGKLMIRNGPDESSPPFAGLDVHSEMCDGRQVRRLESQGDSVFLRLTLKSADEVAFRVAYEQSSSSFLYLSFVLLMGLIAACGGYIFGFAGAISAPQYPQKDSRMLSCEWSIAVAHGNRIRLQFEKIDELDSADGGGLCAPFARNAIDVLADEGADAAVLKRYCRRETAPEPVDSAGNRLVVRYAQSGGSVNGGLFGFTAHFRTLCEDVELDAPHGVLQSPGYPHPVDVGRRCNWRIRTTPGARLRVVFHSFRVRDIDRVQVNYTIGTKDGVQVDDAKETRFCANTLEPQEIVSRSNELEFKFQSGGYADNHFFLSWSTVGCGGRVLENGTTIAANLSDFVPPADSARRRCDWAVRAPVGFVVRVHVLELHTIAPVARTTNNTDVPANCRRDPANPDAFNGLEFYSGIDAHNTAVDYAQDAFCGTSYDLLYLSHTNELLLRLDFAANKTQSRHGRVFRALITFERLSLNTSCGGNATIRSPNYPKAYARAVECVWQLETRAGFSVAFNLSAYATPNQHARKNAAFLHRPSQSTRCSPALGYIEGSIAFFGGPYERPTGGYTGAQKGALERICVDIDRPVLVRSNRNVSTVTFNGAPYEPTVPSGDAAKKAPVGFHLEAFAACGGTLWATSRPQHTQLGGLVTGERACELRVERDEADGAVGAAQPLFVRLEGVAHFRSLRNDSPIEVRARCGQEKNLIVLNEAYDQLSAQPLRTVKCDTPVTLAVAPIAAGQSLVVSYDTESTFCGGQFPSTRGRVNLGRLAGAFDCEWTLAAGDGNRAVVTILDTFIEPSDFCAESFVEIRQTNESGRLLARLCGAVERRRFVASQLFVRLKQTARSATDSQEEGEDENEQLTAIQGRDAKFSFSYEKELGGAVSGESGRLQLDFWWAERLDPDDADRSVSWQLTAAAPASFIRVRVLKRAELELQLFDHHCERRACAAAGREPTVRLREGEIFDPTAVDSDTPSGLVQEFVIPASEVTVFVPEFRMGAELELVWEQVLPDAANRTGGAVGLPTETSDFAACGGELPVGYEPRTLELPTENGVYANDLRCKWRIRRPMLGGISFTFKKLDLEEGDGCEYDYVVITSRDVDSFKELQESRHLAHYCDKGAVGREIAVNYDQNAFVYFVSDRSRRGAGFSLEYRVGCRTFEYIEATKGLFDVVLESPNYPHTYREAHRCQWGVILETNRDVNITSVDVDLAPRNAANKCDTDVLTISDMPLSMRTEGRVVEACGGEAFNFTARSGHVFIQFDSAASSTPRRGYRLQVREIVHSCSSQAIHVDEHTRRFELRSPDWPHVTPNSVDCRWTLSVPPGHRVKFTVDPKTFNLQNASPDRCTDDFLEVHDGATAGAPLVGRFCNERAPSTIVSSDSHLFVRFSTDNYTPSPAWTATVELAACGGTVVLRPDANATITSPNFSDVYPPQETCEWRVHAPRGHITRTHVKYLFLAYSANCSRDFLEVREQNATGRPLLPPTCMQRVDDPTDFFTSALTYVRFQSNSSQQSGGGKLHRMFCPNRKCGFELEFSVERQECGGEITDDEGVRFVHTRDQRVVPGLRCEFDFRAGIGHRWRVEFFFVTEDEDDHGFYQRWTGYTAEAADWCFPDLEVWNGPQETEHSLFASTRRFCENRTTFVSTTDIMSMAYEDRRAGYVSAFPVDLQQLNESRFYRPFGFRYQKVDAEFDSNACMHHVIETTDLSIANLSYRSDAAQQGYVDLYKTFCHIRVDNPQRQTVRLRFTNFRAGRTDAPGCSPHDNRVRLTDSATAAWPVDELLCSATVRNGTAEFVFAAPQLDVFVTNNPFGHGWTQDTTVRFNLSVVFNPCGGHVRAAEFGNSGRIQSPGSPRAYANDADCIWVLEAPEGQLNITRLDLEHSVDCEKDFLEISEGEDRHAVVGRWCYEEGADVQFAMPERFRRLKSHGRFLTLRFHSDGEGVRRGFEALWRFTHFEDGTCGFTSHAESGVIRSPGFPADYPNDAQCEWFVTVPPGFHIELAFTRFDVEPSSQCHKDFVNVTAEQNAREKDPLQTYFFFYDHEEAAAGPLCDTRLPPPFRINSTQMRVYFRSDSTTTARCGTTLRLNHGVVQSPHFPRGYPNEDRVCEWLIDPETEQGVQIVTLRVVDADLDNSLVTTGRRCNADFVEITDVRRKRVVLTICGDSFKKDGTNDVVSVNGPIGVRFVSNATLARGLPDGPQRKNRRGFRLSYAVAECGGEINLGEGGQRSTAVVSSPGFPLPYHEDLDCVWNITAPADSVIAVKFTQINVEGSEGCLFDYVELFDGPTASNETSLGRLCGPVPADGHRTTGGNRAVLRFVSDRSSAAQGFFAVLTATLGPRGGCGGELTATADWQSLLPPLTAEGTYPHNLRCLWKIQPARGERKHVLVRLNSLELETRRRDDSDRCYDFLAIYDGRKAVSPFLLRPTCDVPSHLELPIAYESSFDGGIEVYFETDAADAFGGFNLTYRTVHMGESCGGVFFANNTTGEIEYHGEKGLTRTKQRHRRCRYVFHGRGNQPLEITFLDFNFTSRTPDCTDEFASLRDVGLPALCQHPACAEEREAGGRSTRFCGTHAPVRWVSRTSFVQLVTSELLQSEYTAHFRLQYRVLDSCNRTISVAAGDRWASGRVTSPNYPRPYGHNATCTTTIEVPEGRRVLLVFTDFNLEEGAQQSPWGGRRVPGLGYSFYNYGMINCHHDSLTILFNASTPEVNSTYCGMYPPPTHMSPANSVLLRLETDEDVAAGGYAALYFTAREEERPDGSRFFDFAPTYEPEGVLTNIGYPDAYPENTTQRWTVVPPAGMECAFRLFVHLGYGRACSADQYVRWAHFSGADSPREWIQLPCRTSTPAKEIRLPAGERALFEFRSYANRRYNDLGLKVSWTCRDVSTPVFMLDDWGPMDAVAGIADRLEDVVE